MQAIGGVLVLVTAAVLLQVCSAVQYYFSRDGIRNEVRQRAVSEMKVKNLKILQMVTRVETLVANMQWELEKSMAHPDSVYPVLRRIMATSPDLVGCAIAFQPEYFPDKGHWNEPYMFRSGDSLVDKQIGSATHNYFEMPWYTDGLASDHGLWTEPYIDSSGSEGIVCTYTIPLCDTSGRKVALFGADVTLDWLSDLFEQKEAVITYLFSHAGRMIVCPDSSMAMRFTLDEASSAYNDTTSKRINRNILEGRQGDAEVEYQGEKYQTDKPDEIMRRMNDAMSEMNENSLFVTFFIGSLDFKTGDFSYSNAGHCPPILIGTKTTVLEMDANIPLGIMPGWDYTRQETHVDSDTIIFNYTDGLDHGQYGEERMLAELEKMGSATPRTLIDHMSEVIHNFEAGTEQSDDLTMLAIKFNKHQ